MGRDDYFALRPTEEIGSALVEKVEKYYRYINSSRLLELWREIYKYYYFGFFARGHVPTAGKQAEKRYSNENHFKSLLEHIKVLTTTNRPSFEPRAVNNDYKSTAQVVLARGLLDYYMRQENLEEIIDAAMDYALISGEGWIMQEWDDMAGKVTGQEEPTEEEIEQDLEEDKEVKPKLLHEGNLKSYAFHAIDVIRDYSRETSEEGLWYIVRRYIDKYELAAKYPDFEEEIIGQEDDRESRYQTRLYEYDDERFIHESDQIPLYTFRHKKCSALPEGRQVEFVADGTALFDGDLPYNDIALYRIMPNKKRGSCFGYTVGYDLLPLQKILDMITSSIVTNINAFGTQVIAAPKGSGVQPSQLAGGLNLIEYNGDKGPEALRLLATPAEVYNYKQDIIQQMETVSGVNSVSRGNPEASLKSGAALALVQSMAIQFNTGLQHSYAKMLEDVGTGTINILKKFAQSPRVALISGISKKQYIREFTGDDLKEIDRVIVDIANPLSKTLSGRLAIADTLLERGAIQSPRAYIELINTGRLDPVVDDDYEQQMQVNQENEKLLVGEQTEVMVTDKHSMHISGHAAIFNNPEVRKDQQIQSIALAHMQEHVRLLRVTDPALLMMLGEQSLMPPPPPPGAPQQQPLPPGPEQGIEQQMPSMPSMPNNPMTGENFDNQTGGL